MRLFGRKDRRNLSRLFWQLDKVNVSLLGIDASLQTIARAFEPTPEEPKDNSLPPCSDCARTESSCENERQTCTSPENIHVLTQAGPEEDAPGCEHLWMKARLTDERWKNTGFWMCSCCGKTSPGPTDNEALDPRGRSA